MLEVILNTLKEIIAEEQAGYEPKETPRNISSASESCVKNTSNIKNKSVQCLLFISRKPFTGCDIQFLHSLHL